MKHYETHLYTYANFLYAGEKIKPDNLIKMRDKAIRNGHTEGECQCVELDPLYYIKTGEFNIGRKL